MTPAQQLLVAEAWMREVQRGAEAIHATPREQVRRPSMPQWLEEAP